MSYTVYTVNTIFYIDIIWSDMIWSDIDTLVQERLTHWSYTSLALTHRYDTICDYLSSTEVKAMVRTSNHIHQNPMDVNAYQCPKIESCSADLCWWKKPKFFFDWFKIGCLILNRIQWLDINIFAVAVLVPRLTREIIRGVVTVLAVRLTQELIRGVVAVLAARLKRPSYMCLNIRHTFS